MRFFSSFLLLVCPAYLLSQEAEKAPIQGSVVLEAGEASAFELPLGDFGKGPVHQDLSMFSFSNVFRNEDALSVYGWQAIDTRGVVNWIGNAGYRFKLLKIGKSAVALSSGIQRWEFPSVDHTKVWTLDNSAYYVWPGKIPISFETNLKTAISGNQEYVKGTCAQFFASASHTLFKKGKVSLVLRHGPTYIHAFGIYGVHGPGVARYDGALALHCGSYMFQFQARRQEALQSALTSSNYWTFNVSRALRLFGPR